MEMVDIAAASQALVMRVIVGPSWPTTTRVSH